jgi:hypothetical protein
LLRLLQRHNGNGYTTPATTGETVVVSPAVPQDPPGDAGPVELRPEGDAAEWTARDTGDGWELVRVDVADMRGIDPPASCPACGGIDVWQDLAGRWHCSICRTCNRPALIPGQPGRQVGLCFDCWSKRP